jgi:hypothetical protein
MTLQEICDALKEGKVAYEEFALQGEAVPEKTIPEEVLNEDFLADNVLKINDLLNNRGVREGNEFEGGLNQANYTSEGAFIAQLQENAFLASYQRAAGLKRRSRLDRLASKYTRTIVNGRDYGPLAGQLRDIGVKADYDFTSFILPEEEQ